MHVSAEAIKNGNVIPTIGSHSSPRRWVKELSAILFVAGQAFAGTTMP